MKNLFFDYQMRIDYEKPVTKCNFTLKCIPQSDERQVISDLKVEIIPSVSYSRGTDGFRNCQIYGVLEEMHASFVCRVSGMATVGLNDYEMAVDDCIDRVFRYPHGLNCAGEGIRQYYASYESSLVSMQNDYERALYMMHALHRDFNYESGVTDVSTTAEEAFQLGRGVCQDYAHIFIALMHMAGIAARYVTGLIMGEGASHAWVEILYDGKWYGLDPTNDVEIAEEQIRIGIGRDANDCMINRGIMQGGGNHLQTIYVNVTECGAIV